MRHQHFLVGGAVLALLSPMLSPVEAKRKSTVSSMEEFWMFFAVIYGLVLLPIVGYFLYALARDPATPELGRLMWQWLKRKTLRFLGPHRDPAVQHVREHATSAGKQT
jgi:hypothetical protein